MPKRLPRYPVFIPSRGRADRPLSARMFAKAGVPFHFVVEPREVPAYVKEWGEDRVLVLPENDRGLVYSRNWIKDYSRARGDARHWQFDDDIRVIRRVHHGRRIPCSAGVALAACEDFTERYENVALTSLNATMFLPVGHGKTTLTNLPPFYRNARCYTDFLVLNSLPNRWRGRYNEDTDMTLQVLADGWCTLLINAFAIETPATLTAKGGQMSSAAGSYQGDGRLKMSRELERRWPGVVTTKRRFHRPQHAVKGSWQLFDTPLRRRPDAGEPTDYGLSLRAKSSEGSALLEKIYEEGKVRE